MCELTGVDDVIKSVDGIISCYDFMGKLRDVSWRRRNLLTVVSGRGRD